MNDSKPIFEKYNQLVWDLINMIKDADQ